MDYVRLPRSNRFYTTPHNWNTLEIINISYCNVYFCVALLFVACWLAIIRHFILFEVSYCKICYCYCFRGFCMPLPNFSLAKGSKGEAAKVYSRENFKNLDLQRVTLKIYWISEFAINISEKYFVTGFLLTFVWFNSIK